jgi:hypothetical protein
MKAIFNKMRINYILIEEQSEEATIETTIENNEAPVQLSLNLTDLNRLLSKLNKLGVEISLNDNFNRYLTDKGELFTLNMNDFGWDHITIDEFIPHHEVKQIRA